MAEPQPDEEERRSSKRNTPCASRHWDWDVGIIKSSLTVFYAIHSLWQESAETDNSSDSPTCSESKREYIWEKGRRDWKIEGSYGWEETLRGGERKIRIHFGCFLFKYVLSVVTFLTSEVYYEENNLRRKA